ncbi:MAG: SMC-Scp complex subunit ScpB [Oscillospiraceae bacterium]|nr:SMC-Scp complex subunit ScpB [Oscillospiraceae bacterium]
MDTEQIGSALEAILFAAGDSVEMSRVAKILGVESWEVRRAAEKLRSEYEEGRRGVRMVRMEERIQLVTAPEHAEIVTRALEKRPPARLSPTALEVLAIVAYYQPVTRAYIEQMRGADSSYTVAMLTERGLIAPCGRLEAPGRPVLFGTTEQFLRVMGLSSLQELPPLPNVATGEGIEALQEAIEAASGKDSQLSIEEME